MTIDYPYIRAWHYTTGSMPSYVDDLVARARRMKAPQDTCYFDGDQPVTAASMLARDPEHEAVARCKRWIEVRVQA